jgi:hypothetical protein
VPNTRTARCTLAPVKGAARDDRRRLYQIFYGDEPSWMPSAWRGPFRDKTAAENAAHDEAARSNIELEWVYVPYRGESPALAGD